MKRTICIITILLTCVLLLLQARTVNRAKYRHVRTNKKAWVKDKILNFIDTPIPEDSTEVYVSDDSLLIVSNWLLSGVDVIITDYLHDDAEVFSQFYDWQSPIFYETRIPIIDFPEGIYKITIKAHYSDNFMFGYFGKGAQYEEEAETLGIPTVSSSGSDTNEIYDLHGRKIPATSIRKGQLFIVGGKKYKK